MLRAVSRINKITSSSSSSKMTMMMSTMTALEEFPVTAVVNPSPAFAPKVLAILLINY